MAHETCGFDAWLDGLSVAAPCRPVRAALDAVSASARQVFGARLWFAEVLGARWSYVAGQADDEPSLAPVGRILLDREFGLLVGAWGAVPPDRRNGLVDFLRRLIASARDQG